VQVEDQLEMRMKQTLTQLHLAYGRNFRKPLKTRANRKKRVAATLS
jgi:hypothetical protein